MNEEQKICTNGDCRCTGVDDKCYNCGSEMKKGKWIFNTDTNVGVRTPEEELRQKLADLRFNNEAGITGSLAANMEPEYFDGLLVFIHQIRNEAISQCQVNIWDSWKICGDDKEMICEEMEKPSRG